MSTRVLILAASYGEGHWQASRATETELRRREPDAEVSVLDFGQFLNPAVNSLARYTYLQSIRRAPRLYGEFYYRTMRIRPDSGVQRRLNRLGHTPLQAALNRQRPDLVVCTHPTPAGVMSRLRQSGLTDVTLATIVTDYAVHSQWLHPMVDMYFVGSEFMRDAFIQWGLSPETVHATGIPIRAMFSEPVDREAARARFGLRQDLPTILLMGGACSVLSQMERIPRLLRELDQEVQVLTVCGRRERMRRRMEREADRFGRERMKVYGYVEQMGELMGAADLIITKAGGLTTTEALAMNLPIVIYRPIVGQEEENTRFLVGAGAAVATYNLKDLKRCLHGLLQSPENLRRMRAAARIIAKPHAAQALVSTMLERLRIGSLVPT